MGPDSSLKYAVTALVAIQIAVCMMISISDCSWSTIFILGYCFGGVINHALTLAIHEIAHNLAFGHSRPMANRILGFFANLPIGVPMSISFKKYHLEHHRYQGDEILDTDIPCLMEAKIFCNTVSKVFWVLLQPLFYSFRPFFVNPKAPSLLENVNLVIQVAFDVAVVYFLGIKPLIYLIAGTLLAMGLHPVAGHFISEHYMFLKGHETYSYYGPLNYVTFNVGYHMEHHDFPYIAGSKLEQVWSEPVTEIDALTRRSSRSLLAYASHISQVRVVGTWISVVVLSQASQGTTNVCQPIAVGWFYFLLP